MYDYRITFDLNGLARSLIFSGESDGEALELFELSRYGEYEVLSIVELPQND